jgi:hypothetical protein
MRAKASVLLKFNMKRLPMIFSAAVLLLSACSSTKQTDAGSTTQTDSIAPADTVSRQLTGRILIRPVIKESDSVTMTFTVYNTGKKDQTFCKWHTPFEPPMSKYLDVVDENGNEVNYLGAMAKRVMPPPADSYLKVTAGDSLSVVADLRKSYQLSKPGRYTIKYNSEGISGISVKDSVNFEIIK